MPRTQRSTTGPSRALALTGLVPLLAALLVGCAGASPNKSAAAKEQAKEQNAETKLADLAKCMREHGFSAEVATMPGGGHGIKIRPGSAHGPAALETAEKACARYQTEPKIANLSPQQEVEQQEAVQKFAKCMREHGIKVEASAHGGRVQIQIHGHPGAEGGPNPESPAFQRAQSTCQKLFPRGGP